MRQCVVDNDTLALEKLTAAHGPVMSRLWQLYWHDLSEYRDVPPRADGTFKEFDMPSFLGAEADRSGFLLWRGDDLAGWWRNGIPCRTSRGFRPT